MISWNIWKALDRPFVAHPIYRRYAMWNQSFVPKPKPGRRDKTRKFVEQHETKLLNLTILTGLIIAVLYGLSPLLIIAAVITGSLLFIVLPLTILFSSTFYGLSVAVHISDSIAVEKKQGRYIFMALTPYGLAGTAWAMCSVTLHTHQTLVTIRHNLLRLFMWISMLALLVALLLLLFLVIGAASSVNSYDERVNIILQSFDVFVMAMIIIVDYLQSTTIGCIVGMLAPSLAKTPSDIRNFATGIFGAVQFGTYIVIITICIFVWPDIYASAGIDFIPTFPIACLVTFYLCREVIIIILWLLFAWQTNTRFDELELFTRVKIRGSLLFMLVYKPLSLIRHRDIKALKEEVKR